MLKSSQLRTSKASRCSSSNVCQLPFTTKRNGSKGQWFLISAVVITGAFLTMSGLFKSYFIVDPSDTARTNEDYYFSNVREQFSNVVYTSNCTLLDRNLREFKAFEEREMANKGYLLFINYTLSGCSVSQPGILLASNKMVICQNVDPADVLPNVIDVICARV